MEIHFFLISILGACVQHWMSEGLFDICVVSVLNLLFIRFKNL